MNINDPIVPPGRTAFGMLLDFLAPMINSEPQEFSRGEAGQRITAPRAETNIPPEPVVAASPAPAPEQTTRPGAIPIPQARPAMPEILAKTLGVPFGPSISPSQEGVMASPSQGPGEAVTQPDGAMSPLAKLGEILQLGQQSGGDMAGARAPAPPGPSRMSRGALPQLIGGQNPLAQQRVPVIELLSKLLGGR